MIYIESCAIKCIVPHFLKRMILGPGLGQSLGNREQIISSMAMGNLVNGGNIGSSLSSVGLNMPGVASRLNLTSKSRHFLHFCR